jgi:hypothetical protein
MTCMYVPPSWRPDSKVPYSTFVMQQSSLSSACLAAYQLRLKHRVCLRLALHLCSL